MNLIYDSEKTRLNSQSKLDKKTRLDRELFSVEQELKSKKQELAKVGNAKATVENLNREIKSLQDKKSNVERELQSKMTELAALRSQVNAAQEKYEQMRDLDPSVQAIKDEIAFLESEVKSLEDKRDLRIREFAVTENELFDKRENLKEEIVLLKKKKDQIKSDNKLAQIEKVNLSEKVDESTVELESLLRDIEKQEKKLVEVQHKNEELTTSLKFKENELSRFDDLMKRKEETFNKQVEKKESEINNREVLISEREQKLEDALVQLRTMASSIEEVHGKPIRFNI